MCLGPVQLFPRLSSKRSRVKVKLSSIVWLSWSVLSKGLLKAFPSEIKKVIQTRISIAIFIDVSIYTVVLLFFKFIFVQGLIADWYYRRIKQYWCCYYITAVFYFAFFNSDNLTFQPDPLSKEEWYHGDIERADTNSRLTSIGQVCVIFCCKLDTCLSETSSVI